MVWAELQCVCVALVTVIGHRYGVKVTSDPNTDLAAEGLQDSVALCVPNYRVRLALLILYRVWEQKPREYQENLVLHHSYRSGASFNLQIIRV